MIKKIFGALLLSIFLFPLSSLQALELSGPLKLERFKDIDPNQYVNVENIIFQKQEALGKIIGAFKKVKYLMNGDTVYLKLQNAAVSVGDRYMIYSDEGGVDVPGSAFDTKGRRIVVKGYTEVIQVLPRAIVARIQFATTNILVGDKLGEYFDIVTKIQGKEPDNYFEGKVLRSADNEVMVSSFKFAFIDKGKADGLELNDRLSVIRAGDGGQAIKKDLPRVEIAKMVVVHLEEHVATAYCISASETFESGAIFKADRSEVRYLDEKVPVWDINIDLAP
jgi:hypothetical protein